jgi:hypothetical protein
MVVGPPAFLLGSLVGSVALYDAKDARAGSSVTSSTGTPRTAEYRNGWRELYDLKADPFEVSDLANREAREGLQRRLARQLQGLLKEPSAGQQVS